MLKKCLTKGEMTKVNNAINSHLPATRRIQRIAERNEKRLGRFLKKANHVPDNDPFDVFVGADVLSPQKAKHFIEVKTIVRGKNNKITMHGSSLKRKLDFAEKYPNAKIHTVVFDERENIIYYKEGLGSFRLNSMKKVTEEELKGILK